MTEFRNSLLMSAALVGALWAGDVRADTRECSKKEAFAAEQEASVLKSWGELYHSYKRYSHCDDGAISEGYSYSVAWLLTERWSKIGEFLAIVKQSSDFEDFVVSHVNETMSQYDADIILRNVSTRCPKAGLKFCPRLKKAVDASS
jgi:hypothetical protein